MYKPTVKVGQTKELDVSSDEHSASLLPGPPSGRQGVLIGGCRLGEKIGEGGSSVIYSAVEVLTSRRRAVKLLKSDLIKGVNGPLIIRRFLREAKLAERWRGHPNLIQVFESGLSVQGPYLVLELLHGISLAQIIQAAKVNPLHVSFILRYVREVCRALSVAHTLGIIHRDLKPANVHLCNQDGIARVVLLDFGIAFPLNQQRMTPVRTFVGTLGIMPPEQYVEEDPASYIPDRRADIWAVGVLIYQLCTGMRPYKAKGYVDFREEVLNEEPPPIHRSDLPLELLEIIWKCLEKSPEDRYQCVEDILSELRRVPGFPTGPFMHLQGPADVPSGIEDATVLDPTRTR